MKTVNLRRAKKNHTEYEPKFALLRIDIVIPSRWNGLK